MQSRTIIVSRFPVATIRLIRRATQRGLSFFLVFDHLATVFEGREARLHLIEFRCRDYILIFRWQDLRDLLLRVLDAIWCRGMRSKGLSQSAWLLLLSGLNLFEEVDHRLRIIAAGIQILRSQIVG